MAGYTDDATLWPITLEPKNQFTADIMGIQLGTKVDYNDPVTGKITTYEFPFPPQNVPPPPPPPPPPIPPPVAKLSTASDDGLHVRISMPDFVASEWDNDATLVSFDMDSADALHFYQPEYYNFRPIIDGEYIQTPVRLETVNKAGEAYITDVRCLQLGLIFWRVMRNGAKPKTFTKWHYLT